MVKRPAYAHTLLAARQRGRHPMGVQVIIGEPWRPLEHCPWPRLAIRPSDWRPKLYDWSVCAGLPVICIDRSLPEDDTYYRIAAEINLVAAYVRVEPGAHTLADEARLQRLAAGTWPSWWNDAAEARARANDTRWRRELLTFLTPGGGVDRCAA